MMSEDAFKFLEAAGFERQGPVRAHTIWTPEDAGALDGITVESFCIDNQTLTVRMDIRFEDGADADTCKQLLEDQGWCVWGFGATEAPNDDLTRTWIMRPPDHRLHPEEAQGAQESEDL